ncbi:MAG: hypothetical protein UU13_C0008G0005 [Candidatus Nomurabacteria bacterium GW2011_GWB1_40_7]|uniref:LVIVD repeat protein n=1 Tax=Candidatus Nomurabacteria bacterium GW2011_GWB1_40_7 TaxID=1618744 RepID=A0A0G0SZW6_9BACT|nr:MAG: hypothetical protein UU13_C0008G0005 [Candidatus Nomurabacteria bacterium GW2011_GWB1_40_7]
MKAQLTGSPKGFITLEILIAFAVVILSISAVIMVTFGNQSVAVDSQVNLEAISKAQALLEKARADSRLDFNLVNSSVATEMSGPLMFTKTLDVIQADLFTKKVTSIIAWQIVGKTFSTTLATILTNPEAASGGDTCSSVLTGDWKNPQIERIIDFSSISPIGTYTLTDVDAYKNKLYVTSGKTTNTDDPTLFVFDTSDTSNPTLLGEVDNAPAVISGLNAVRVSEDLATSKIYAYTASNTSSDYTSCDPVANPACGQLYIFDVTNPSSPTFSVNLKIASSPPITSQNTGTSIFYKNGYVFLGLGANASGPEFHIIDMRNPASLFGGSHLVSPLGSFEVGNGVNVLLSRDSYAYIASPNTQELQILDISNLNNPIFAGSFNSPNGAGNGKSIYLVGDKLYLGKTTGASFDFHILDNTNSAVALPEFGGRDISSSVNGVTVKNFLSFLLTGTPGTGAQLQIFKTDDPLNITPWNPSPFIISPAGNATEPSMDCEGNRLYISSNDSAGQGSIYIIKPGP